MSVDEFEGKAEDAIGQEIWVDEELGNDLGWFMVETEMELQEETFEAEVDFNLSESGVSLLYAEITIDPSDVARKSILEEEATILDRGDDYALYEYYPEENEIDDLLKDLNEVCSRTEGL
ncbi:hypothetical protein [Halorubrum sp. DTA46]|uniref:hypothetical protein n=1 Tax=Halorubrum sp. DTA46 TaxID=3402162 RepID=UPI003AAA56F0